MSGRPLVSIVIASYNRRDILLQTLDRLGNCGIPPDQRETIVVDNASEDGTPDALIERRDVRCVRLTENLGSCAKALGAEAAHAELLLFLDDDSYPRPGCLWRMIDLFEHSPSLAAAGFAVRLLDGGQECSALPGVFVGCGVGLRAAAVRRVGGLDRSFFMQAEEYDLSFRLAASGYHVARFSDLAVEHLKTPQARRPAGTTYYDIRNNLRVIARYLPDEPARVYRRDWIQRYEWLAQKAGHVDAYLAGLRDGLDLAERERAAYARWRLTQPAFEAFFSWERIQHEMFRLQAAGLRRLVLFDLSKNIYPFVRGARAAGMEIAAIADDHLVGVAEHYRGLPITTVDAAVDELAQHPTSVAAVVSNTSYVHAGQRAAELAPRLPIPIEQWFDPPQPTTAASYGGSPMHSHDRDGSA